MPPTNPNRPHDARAVANHFVERATAEGVDLTHLKLQKLVYFAHGWHLAVTGHPLVLQTVLAWPYGPVIRDVYDSFRHFGRRAIDKPATYLDPVWGEWVPFTANYRILTDSVLERVWAVYKGYSGEEMSAMAHAEGTPWHRKVGHMKPEQIRDVLIPNDLIRQHYLKLAKERDGITR